MAVKIRLARHGKKNHAFFHIVVADIRAPRDGRYIERIGSYDPNTNPATISLDADRALYWLGVGAQPTDTCRRILSFEGVLLRKHLTGGVAKGALTEEAAQQKWEAWKAERDSKIASKKQNIARTIGERDRELLKAEAKVNQERAEAIAKKKAEEAAAAAEAAAKAAAEAAEAAGEATEAPAESEATTQE
ncbi:MAG TPA: 30S ribosomal protein S16 [Candidatus Coprenecus stercoripullorum]|nr:30S ribosomal protein S16 [Candidatus Coprenecus stercoripullorum]